MDAVVVGAFFQVVFSGGFAKLRASRAFAPSVPLCLRALHVLRVFVPYLRLCLTLLCVLRAFVRSRLKYRTHAPHLPALRAFFKRLARLIFEIYNVFGWICSPVETFHFSRTIKAKSCYFYVCQKTAVKISKWEKFLSIFI